MQTKNLKLVLQTLEQARAEVEAMSPADKVHLSADWLARLRGLTSADPWTLGYSLVHRDSGTVVGSAGFKGPPEADGMVEIAYGIHPEHQGKGYATEAAQALTTYAFGSGMVRMVRAHTLPEPNASTRVLTKCGFRRVGEVIDAEDGLVWRWEKAFEAPAEAAEDHSMAVVNSERVYHRLKVLAAPGTVIWLVDDLWHPVQKGVGTLETSVLRGRYFVELGPSSPDGVAYPIELFGDLALSQEVLELGAACPRQPPKLLDDG